MTEDQAKQLYDSKFWEHLDHRQRAEFQIIEDRLCMPFDVFHEAIEKALRRWVWTHEFALNRAGLIDELFHGRPAPTLEAIMALIPEEKRIVVVV